MIFGKVSVNPPSYKNQNNTLEAFFYIVLSDGAMTEIIGLINVMESESIRTES